MVANLTVCPNSGDRRSVSTATREKPLFHDDLAIITSTRAILGGTTYAIANVTSVRYQAQAATWVFVLIGFLLALIGAFLFNVSATHSIIITLVGLAGSVTALAMRKTKHWVVIGTAGSERRAVFSHNQYWTTNVVEALNQAIIDRG
jgi:hypothetical protein